MNNLDILIKDLKEKGVQLLVIDNELKIQSPKGLITPEIQKLLIENKSNIINLLKKEAIKMNFSLFFFSDDLENEQDKYKLLIDSTKMADKNGFYGIWTPERHFHKMGNIYPNPAIISGALSTITENVILRAGSVVLPINDPIRVAENWSVVDNLSKGRVELSFATGWHINDFVFEPSNYEKRKDIMFERIDIVKKLWQGETIKRKNGANKEIEVEIYPKPYNKNLAIWITAIGNPETYIQAGKRGFNLMTCLLDQDISELKEKIILYKKELVNAGYSEKDKKICIFMHTYLDDSMEKVKEKVREPFKNYLKSTIDLLGKFSQNSDISLDPSKMNENEKEELLEFAFERYFKDRTFFGNIEDLREKVIQLHEIGVDEIACLIDFGLDHNSITQSLEKLSFLVKNFKA
ncbi:MAG: MupA/Atu3671 family FMN-dependent luciferase-like monooxygenase [Cyanobacteriota bacterium]